MSRTDPTLARLCAQAGIAAGRQIRQTIYAMAPAERAQPCASLLKRDNVRADKAGEDVAIRCLEALSKTVGYRIVLIVDVGSGRTHPIGASGKPDAIFALVDAVDGTFKVGGLGNDLSAGKLRLANDGAWAATMAFTAPTTQRLDDLSLGDFAVATSVDGNPTRYATYPQEVMTIPGADGITTYDVTGGTARRVFTSSNRCLSQSMVFLDAFQAFDLETRRDGDDAVAVALYRLLINRHDGGAFDVLRQFGTLSALQRMMLGWRDGDVWCESQGGAFIVVNENLPNLIPSVAIIAGAGGASFDFEGHTLRDRRLTDGRTSVVHAANDALRNTVLALVARAAHRPVSRA